jgi:hypothetical protein
MRRLAISKNLGFFEVSPRWKPWRAFSTDS